MVNVERYTEIKNYLDQRDITLVAVSKIKPVSDIMEMYKLGQRDFGENYVQELVEKALVLPKDIRWHFIGHMQSNKIKYLAPFVHMIQGVDSPRLLQEINKQAGKCDRVIDCLLQVHIAQEETKFGFDAGALPAAVQAAEGFANVRIRGLMGMASFSDNDNSVRAEFKVLKHLYDEGNWDVLSMGMSGDYKMAVEEGSTMVRIGSLLFGAR